MQWEKSLVTHILQGRVVVEVKSDLESVDIILKFSRPTSVFSSEQRERCLIGNHKTGFFLECLLFVCPFK